MSQLLHAIRDHAGHRPDAIALRGEDAVFTYASLQQEILRVSEALREQLGHAVALLADNSPQWAIIDLAAIHADIPFVPLPLFFSPDQIRHALLSAGVDRLLVPAGAGLPALGGSVVRRSTFAVGGKAFDCLALTVDTQALPPRTQKITYTSGTTGAPKGVCLSLSHMEQVAFSLGEASGATASDTHLSALPLSTLLENIGGLYTPLLAGASTCLRPMAQVGLEGAVRIDGQRLQSALDEASASTVILVPHMLDALVAARMSNSRGTEHLRFVAVGGAPVSPRLLQRAQSVGLPVYEGYGLSECASVVSMNRPGAFRTGSVGRPLSHLSASIAADGEILVKGARSLGYVGETLAESSADQTSTGDIGHLDDDGFLHVTGRKKNLFITAFGRNVAPEWVERELVEEAGILQAAVFGEGRAWNAAVIVGSADRKTIAAAVRNANSRLPDYARVSAWISADSPFAIENGQLTANGRLRRDAILARYGEPLNSLYKEPAA